MGRPLQFDHEEALDVAMNALWRSGYDACSVKALSEQLGITRSSFYNTFGSREALFEAALARYFEQAPDRPLALAKRGGSVKGLISDTFRSVCRARAADPQGRGCLAVNSVAELCNVHDRLGRLMEEALFGHRARIEELLGWAVEQGEIPKDSDIHALALAVQNLLIGINVLSKVVRNEAELWLTARTTLGGLGLLAEHAD